MNETTARQSWITPIHTINIHYSNMFFLLNQGQCFKKRHTF